MSLVSFAQMRQVFLSSFVVANRALSSRAGTGKGAGEMGKISLALGVSVLAAVLGGGCGERAPTHLVELRHLPVDSTDGLVALPGVEFDEGVSSDGNGSVRVTATRPTVFDLVKLTDLDDLDVANATLIYRAKLRSEDLEGQASLIISFESSYIGTVALLPKIEAGPLTGSTAWTTREVVCLLQGQDPPGEVTLCLYIDGRGTVWVDDIRLLKGPPDY